MVKAGRNPKDRGRISSSIWKMLSPVVRFNARLSCGAWVCSSIDDKGEILSRYQKKRTSGIPSVHIGLLEPYCKMKLSDVVNVVAVIAKSDSLTLEERKAFKERIKEEFTFHNLRMYPHDK